jgi:hypothetical protein
MTLRFGFELEGFYRDADGNVALPPTRYPTDGFPGLCELRSTGGKSLDDAYFEVLRQTMEKPFDWMLFEHTFTQEQRRGIRARPAPEKEAVFINNIYGKLPRALGNRTLASFQINFSWLVAPESRTAKTFSAARYGMIDFRPYIEKLDKEFAAELKMSNRLPGMYAVKDELRVEYRSLPNFVFTNDLAKVNTLLDRIRKCFA